MSEMNNVINPQSLFSRFDMASPSPPHPLFLRVGTLRDTPPWYGDRASIPLNPSNPLSLNLHRLSLIIPCVTTRSNIPSGIADQRRDASLIEYIHWRYFGYLDLDMPLTEMKDAKQPLFSDRPSVFDYTKEYKMAFIHCMLNESLTFGDMALICPEWAKLLSLVERLFPLLPSACEPVVYYSGGCGIRVLFWSLDAWKRVRWRDDTYAKALTETAMPVLLRQALSLPDELVAAIMTHVDKNVYDVDKGVKPDVLAHFDTGVFPVPFVSAEHFRTQCISKTKAHPVLVSDINRFWRKLFLERVPPNLDSLPLLTGGGEHHVKKRALPRPTPAPVPNPAPAGPVKRPRLEEDSLELRDLRESSAISQIKHARHDQTTEPAGFHRFDQPKLVFPIRWRGGKGLIAQIKDETKPIIIGFTVPLGRLFAYGELKNRTVGDWRASDECLLLSKSDFALVVHLTETSEGEAPDAFAVEQEAVSSNVDLSSLTPLGPVPLMLHAIQLITLIDNYTSILADVQVALILRLASVPPEFLHRWSQLPLFASLNPTLRQSVLDWIIGRLTRTVHAWTREHKQHWLDLEREFVLLTAPPPFHSSMSPVQLATIDYLAALAEQRHRSPDERTRLLQDVRL